jgi:hypothetical protein
MIPFSHAVLDSDGEVLRKYRWSTKEAKWHKEQGKNVVVLPKEPPQTNNNLFTEMLLAVGEAAM